MVANDQRIASRDTARLFANPVIANEICATAVSFMKDPTKVAHLKGLRAERLPSLKHSLSRRITAELLSRQRVACELPAYTSKALHQLSLHKLL